MTKSEAESYVKRFIKSELKKRGMTYGQIAKSFNDKGNNISRHAIACKLSRGNFKASFLLMLMEEIGIEKFVLEDFMKA